MLCRLTLDAFKCINIGFGDLRVALSIWPAVVAILKITILADGCLRSLAQYSYYLKSIIHDNLIKSYFVYI